MKPSIRRRLERTLERFEEVGALLADPDVIARQAQFRDLSMEYSRLEAVAQRFREFSRLEDELRHAEEMAAGADADMRELGADEARALRERIDAEGLELTRLLIPKDPRDDANIFLEIRAGTGGDEAAIFAGDLFRMYSRYAERQGWKVEVLSDSPGEHGGYKEIISRVV
ncbi:MAG TPA: PCRF domain-containing protein, partial [Steroidobacteraceae bacterium]|nr:PCRF domain-containing protein [Steroidobacteraceae bacterium]